MPQARALQAGFVPSYNDLVLSDEFWFAAVTSLLDPELGTAFLVGLIAKVLPPTVDE